MTWQELSRPFIFLKVLTSGGIFLETTWYPEPRS